MIMGASNMSIILSVDGGGSKINAILFDDKFRLLGAGKSGGVNTNSTTLEDCRNNVADCLNQVFRERPPAAIDRLYAVFVGPINVLFEEVEKLTTVRKLFFQAGGRFLALKSILQLIFCLMAGLFVAIILLIKLQTILNGCLMHTIPIHGKAFKVQL
jgi:hypothetical protein